jgi:hypothetical protein
MPRCCRLEKRDRVFPTGEEVKVLTLIAEFNMVLNVDTERRRSKCLCS